MYESTVAIVAEIGSDTPSHRPHEPNVGLCVVPFDARPRNTALRGVNLEVVLFRKLPFQLGLGSLSEKIDAHT
ncbi:hypothetical protein N9D38_10085 [Rubripirellula sp.]|jgi:hypothetical protein|nr:hypothetical protein [Rubripirellula sp.]